MKIREIKPLRPGDEVPQGVGDTVGIHKGRAYAFGVLTSINSLYFLDSQTGRYAPAIDDLVIGKIFYRSADYYKVDLKTAVGTLPSLAFRNATKRFKPELEVNDHVLARVTRVQSECLLSCVENGQGKLDGHVMDMEPWKVRKLYLCPFLSDVGRVHKFECALGLNGRVWIGCDDPVVVREVVHLLQSFE